MESGAKRRRASLPFGASLIRSAEFDDIYFSVEDGLAESRHVYLSGNDLPAAWQGRESFSILELGFGTGLNFLATWEAWRRTAAPEQRLYYYAVEKFPLTIDQIVEALAHWQDEVGGGINALRDVYPPAGDLAGWHQMYWGQVHLQLCVGDVGEVLPKLNGKFDALYLDGFAPAKNPDMWSVAVTDQLARLSHPGTTLATFTVAAVVRQNLTTSGFAVEKAKGFGKKRDMLVGHYAAPRDE